MGRNNTKAIVFCVQQVEIPLPHMIENTIHLQDRVSLPMRAVLISSGDHRRICSMDKASVKWVKQLFVYSFSAQKLFRIDADLVSSLIPNQLTFHSLFFIRFSV
jgi:hypothetical protein